MLMGGIVVDDGVDGFSSWYLRLHSVQETDEFLMLVTLDIAADDRSVEDVQGGKQGLAIQAGKFA
jgi:hypothetical protein